MINRAHDREMSKKTQRHDQILSILEVNPSIRVAAMADDLGEYGYGDLFRGLGANFHADRRDDPIEVGFGNAIIREGLPRGLPSAKASHDSNGPHVSCQQVRKVDDVDLGIAGDDHRVVIGSQANVGQNFGESSGSDLHC